MAVPSETSPPEASCQARAMKAGSSSRAKAVSTPGVRRASPSMIATLLSCRPGTMRDRISLSASVTVAGGAVSTTAGSSAPVAVVETPVTMPRAASTEASSSVSSPSITRSRCTMYAATPETPMPSAVTMRMTARMRDRTEKRGSGLRGIPPLSAGPGRGRSR
ncbi:MAG: hypothetical protein B7Y93_03745 [Micrococcales bacterium 32-70-13]|nr:MAG: hypothetical protein B7Y93_03745 [Micrococcales bacterium 32-70-13]